MVPACATQVVDQMVVQSETDEVRQLRQSALELLLSDHVGDCLAPCQLACPAKLDIPQMLRFIAAEQIPEAIELITQRIALPAVLGRTCPKPCEKVCRRKDIDEPVSICQLKRFAADSDLGCDSTYKPKIQPPSGKRVLVLGAGPTGLSAAYYLCIAGHEVEIWEKESCVGGRLRFWDEEILPQDVLDAEIDVLLSVPIKVSCDTPFDWTDQAGWNGICSQFDAVLIATGADDFSTLGLPTSKNGIAIHSKTYRINSKTYQNVFAAGTAVRGEKALVVRSVVDGREVAEVIDRFLTQNVIKPNEPLFSVKIKKLQPEELAELEPNGTDDPREEPEDVGFDDFSPEEAAAQAKRCLHCDCRGRSDCRLLHYAQQYHAQTDRFHDIAKSPLKIVRSVDVLYEPGKCIKCGRCVAITRTALEPFALALVGRGFDVKIGVPFNETLRTALGNAAQECIAACPTAALVWNDTQTEQNSKEKQ